MIKSDAAKVTAIPLCLVLAVREYEGIGGVLGIGGDSGIAIYCVDTQYGVVIPSFED